MCVSAFKDSQDAQAFGPVAKWPGLYLVPFHAGAILKPMWEYLRLNCGTSSLLLLDTKILGCGV